MTIIVDDNGTRWVEMPRRKRRAPPKRGRFSEVSVGDTLLKLDTFCVGQDRQQARTHYVVTDLWFDPVKGEDNEFSGQMVAVALVRPDGSLSKKGAYSRHALAACGFYKTDRDAVAEAATIMHAVERGQVVGIGHGRTIRKRPKLPGSPL